MYLNLPGRPDPDSQWLFRATWRELQRESICDEIGGAEYVRVLAEWSAAPNHVRNSVALTAVFIARRANIGAEG